MEQSGSCVTWWDLHTCPDAHLDFFHRRRKPNRPNRTLGSVFQPLLDLLSLGADGSPDTSLLLLPVKELVISPAPGLRLLLCPASVRGTSPPSCLTPCLDQKPWCLSPVIPSYLLIPSEPSVLSPLPPHCISGSTLCLRALLQANINSHPMTTHSP